MANSGTEHKHFGYWINRPRNVARCYQCGFQFSTSSPNEAEDWQGDSPVAPGN